MLNHPVTEKEILAALHQTPMEMWPDILAFVQNLKSAAIEQPRPLPWTAVELLKLPRERRERILAEQAARAAADYARDSE